MPPLEPVLAMTPAASAKQREEFMSAVSAWSTSTAWLRVADVEDLPAIPRMLRLLYWFRGDATTEGVWYFISESWGGRYWVDLRNACSTIGATDSLRALLAVEGLFPTGFPTDEHEMQSTMAGFEAMKPDPLAAIDEQFEHAFVDEIPQRLHAYHMNHAAAVTAAHQP